MRTRREATTYQWAGFNQFANLNVSWLHSSECIDCAGERLQQQQAEFLTNICGLVFRSSCGSRRLVSIKSLESEWFIQYFD